MKAKKDLNLKLGKATIIEGDARDLKNLNSDHLEKIDDETIDCIITSPPYSFAIDYLEGDRLQLEYLGYDVKNLKKKMIGLRGSDLKSQVYNYLSDMDKAIKEMSRVLADNRYCVIIIGSNTLQLERALSDLGIKFEDELINISKRHNLILSRRIIRPIEGIRNIMKTESILFLQKQAK